MDSGVPGVNRIVFTNAGHVNHYCDYHALHSHGKLAHDQAVITAFGASQLNVAVPSNYYGNPQTDINDQYLKLRPDLTKLSLPNFLLELDDVTKLFKLWRRNVSTVKNVAGLHLNYKFGWKPTMSDLRALVGVIQGLISKLHAFEKSAGVMRSHTHFLNTVTAKSGSFTYASLHTCKWSGFVERQKSAGLVYRPQPFEVTRTYDMMLRAYLDALGFELNPRILWDATPFTFVIDWFFGVGSWLERHKYDTLELPFLHLDSYVQYKEDVKVTSDLVFHPGNSNSVFTAPYWVTSRQLFVRVPCTPYEQSFIDAGWKLPTGNQALLMVSLATVLAHSR
jgi:hypothetical protein